MNFNLNIYFFFTIQKNIYEKTFLELDLQNLKNIFFFFRPTKKHHQKRIRSKKELFYQQPARSTVHVPNKQAQHFQYNKQ